MNQSDTNLFKKRLEEWTDILKKIKSNSNRSNQLSELRELKADIKYWYDKINKETSNDDAI